eukprot:1178551-Prorocentrum_minimum.AAC.3
MNGAIRPSEVVSSRRARQADNSPMEGTIHPLEGTIHPREGRIHPLKRRRPIPPSAYMRMFTTPPDWGFRVLDSPGPDACASRLFCRTPPDWGFRVLDSPGVQMLVRLDCFAEHHLIGRAASGPHQRTTK